MIPVLGSRRNWVKIRRRFTADVYCQIETDVNTLLNASHASENYRDTKFSTGYEIRIIRGHV